MLDNTNKDFLMFLSAESFVCHQDLGLRECHTGRGGGRGDKKVSSITYLNMLICGLKWSILLKDKFVVTEFHCSQALKHY